MFLMCVLTVFSDNVKISEISLTVNPDAYNDKISTSRRVKRLIKTSFMFLSYMKMISEDPEIIEIMKKNMANNKNNEAMGKLYDIAMDCLK